MISAMIPLLTRPRKWNQPLASSTEVPEATSVKWCPRSESNRYVSFETGRVTCSKTVAVFFELSLPQGSRLVLEARQALSGPPERTRRFSYVQIDVFTSQRLGNPLTVFTDAQA